MSVASRNKHWAWMIGCWLVYALLAMLVDNEYYQRIMTIVLVWAVMGLAWNILSGYSGLISFGHAAFFGLGGYFVVLAQIFWNWSPWFSIPVAGLLGAVAGLVIGIPTIRLRGHYFALAMLAYPLALLYVFEWLGYQEVTVPRETERAATFMQFHDGQMRVYIFIGLAFLAGAMILTRLIERHRFGMSLLAIKQDETAAEAAGINTRAAKIRAITLSGAMAAAIGGFYAIVQIVVTPPSAFGMLISAQALIVAMFGGVGTVWGPVIGAVSLVPLSAWLDAEFSEILPGIQGVLYGLAIIAVVLLAPEGLFWKAKDLLRRWQPEPRPQPPRIERSDDPTPVDFSVNSSRNSATVLEVTALSKAYGGLKAVDNVNLDVRRGEILGVIGPNGAGKTTLFNVLNGFTRPDQGQVLFNGNDIVGKLANKICRLGIGRTFQVVKPFRRMSIADNVVIGAYAHTTRDRDAERVAAQAMAEAGLSDHAHTIAGNISNEHLRRMELARALASRPSLLLLDEIFAGLTSTEVESLSSVIRRLAGIGITIVIIEHTMQAMVQLVDRFVVLDHGSVLATGSPEEITQDAKVVEAYLGKKWMDDA